MLVTPYVCNILYLAQKSPKSPKLKIFKTCKFSIVYSIFLSNFHLSARKPVNVFFEGAISLKTTSITLWHLDI